MAAEHRHVRLFDALGLGDKLCAAARRGDVRAIWRVIEGGAAVSGRDQHGWTPLHRAAFKGHTEAVRLLIDKGAEIDAKDEDGYTALHCAAESGQADVIELLVKKGADLGARTNKGIMALQMSLCTTRGSQGCLEPIEKGLASVQDIARARFHSRKGHRLGMRQSTF